VYVVNKEKDMGMNVTVIHKAFEDAPIKVAEVETTLTDVNEALEYAYRWTNNVMGSWSRPEKTFSNGEKNGDYNPAVTTLAPLHDGMGLRSTSMGDQMVVEGKTYEVAMLGFEEVA
tara:strand:- start:74 stop:421 length:348 start_codon:yes stop_codon:yes gene_type:complete